jgi:hypothetical protein
MEDLYTFKCIKAIWRFLKGTGCGWTIEEMLQNKNINTYETPTVYRAVDILRNKKIIKWQPKRKNEYPYIDDYYYVEQQQPVYV